MEGAKYPNVVRTVLETPWAILPEKLAAIRELIVLRADGVKFTDEEIEARIGAGPSRKNTAQVGATAIIPIYGVITPKADMMTQMSGGTPIDRLRQSFYGALNDAEVSSIVLDVDSPGGQTDQLTEFAAEIRAARGRKPIVAVANTRAASAAYWLASQADEFVVTPSGSVGSVGVFAAHEDISKALEMDGVQTTLISAGKYKTETSPYGPLSDEARQHVQDQVDEQYAMFTSDVAKGRRVSVDSVRSGFGEGRMVNPKAAVKEGMVDGVETMQSVLTRLSQPRPRGNGSQAIQVNLDGQAISQTITTANKAWVDDHPPDDSTTDTPQAAMSGLSFAARLRGTLRVLEEQVEHARSFADVREREHLTGPKREQFEAIVEALGDLGQVRVSIARLLEETDPQRPAEEARQAALAYMAGRSRRRGAESHESL